MMSLIGDQLATGKDLIITDPGAARLTFCPGTRQGKQGDTDAKP